MAAPLRAAVFLCRVLGLTKNKVSLMKMMMIFVVVAAGLAGCNTVDGLGQDVSGGARTVKGWF